MLFEQFEGVVEVANPEKKYGIILVKVPAHNDEPERISRFFLSLGRIADGPAVIKKGMKVTFTVDPRRPVEPGKYPLAVGCVFERRNVAALNALAGQTDAELPAGKLRPEDRPRMPKNGGLIAPLTPMSDGIATGTLARPNGGSR